MSYIGMSWIDTDLREAIATAPDDQHAFALAATAINETLRVGFGKITAELAGLRTEQSLTSQAMRKVRVALDRQTEVFRELNEPSEDWPILEPPEDEPEDEGDGPPGLLPEPPGGGAAGMVNQRRMEDVAGHLAEVLNPEHMPGLTEGLKEAAKKKEEGQ